MPEVSLWQSRGTLAAVVLYAAPGKCANFRCWTPTQKKKIEKNSVGPMVRKLWSLKDILRQFTSLHIHKRVYLLAYPLVHPSVILTGKCIWKRSSSFVPSVNSSVQPLIWPSTFVPKWFHESIGWLPLFYTKTNSFLPPVLHLRLFPCCW